jgi:Ca-activated chloride channel family protein
MTPGRVRGIVALCAVLAIAAGWIWRTTPRPRVVVVKYDFTPDADALLQPLITAFNRSDVRDGGSRIRVEPEAVASGKALSHLDELRPSAWTPASSLWGLLGGEGRGRSLVQSPQVVAVWKEEADRLGLASSESFARILDLVQAGELRFGHTDPNVSTSGLSAVISEYYALTGKTGPSLTSRDVREAREAIPRVEGAIVHYADIAGTFAQQWCRYGSLYASAAYMQETTLLQFNKDCQDQLEAIYPSDFSFVADYPYIVLTDGWVSPEQREAAETFGSWLSGALARNPGRVLSNGFRRGASVTPGTGHGAHPDLPAGPPPLSPRAEVLAAMQRSWSELRRAVHIVLVLDGSDLAGGVGELASEKEAVRSFLSCPLWDRHPSGDKVGMIVTAAGRVHRRVLPGPFEPSRERIRLVTRRLEAQGGAALYDAIERAADDPALRDPSSINSVVVLADGGDDSSSTTPPELIGKLTNLFRTGRPVQVIALVYGHRASATSVVREIVAASRGRFFEGHPSDPSEAEDVAAFVCSFL